MTLAAIVLAVSIISLAGTLATLWMWRQRRNYRAARPRAERPGGTATTSATATAAGEQAGRPAHARANPRPGDTGPSNVRRIGREQAG